MAFKEYGDYDGMGLAELVRKKQVSARELLDEAIARTTRVDPQINAVVVKHYDYAERQVDNGLSDGPFTGVPFLLKDLDILEGTRTTSGASVYKDNVADHSSTLARRFLDAGVAIFGKSSSPEFGLMPTTESRLYGPTRNPWNLAHSSGGSSGGAAAAVAARILPLAHASDGGGSIRIPASASGVFGLKPTRARNPMGPDAGEGWGGASVGHAVTRTVRDSAALLDATAGPDLGDPYWAPPVARPFLEEVGRDPGRLRIALATKPWNGQPVDPECAEAALEAARLCERLGHRVEEASPAVDAAALGGAMLVIIGGNLRAAIEARAGALGREPTPTDVERVTWARALQGHTARAADYARAIWVMHRTARVVAPFFRTYDILLTPTMCRRPHPLGVIDMMTEDEAGYTQAVLSTIAFTSLWNACGNPAMSVPLGWSRDGLPLGVQFVAPFGDEASLFRLGAQLEAAAPWAHRRPLTAI